MRLVIVFDIDADFIHDISLIDDRRILGVKMTSGDNSSANTPDQAIADLAKALAHPARLRILRLLARTPGCIGGDIVEAVGLAQSTVSEHLRILKAAGVITGEIDGPRVCYALEPLVLAALTDFIATLIPLGDAKCCVLEPLALGADKRKAHESL